MAPAIERIETIEFGYELEDVGTPPGGFDVIYDPGHTMERRLFAVRIHVDDGRVGAYVGSNSPGAAQINTVADYLIGKDPLTREKHWSELKRALRKYDRMGIGPLDVALWDYAGKRYDAPLHELLGTYRQRLPAYASTYQGDQSGDSTPPRPTPTSPRRAWTGGIRDSSYTGGTATGATWTNSRRPSAPSANASATRWT